MSEHVGVVLEPPVTRITLDRPPLNVLTTAMMRAMEAAVERASRTDGMRVVRIDAVGRAFSAGVDVEEHMGEDLVPMMEALTALFQALERTPLVSVAVVRAAALGGGCEVALGTDLCLASERASFGQPEIKLGVFAPPASVLLPRILGERRALGLLLSGDTVPAREALAMGLVNHVFSEERFDAEVEAYVGRIAAHSGAALRFAKQAVAVARGRPTPEAHREVLRLYLDRLMETEDAHEGLRAFLEKRPPIWTHR